MPTLKDLAQECGLSQSTLSRALNHCAGTGADAARIACELKRKYAIRPFKYGEFRVGVILPDTPKYFWHMAWTSLRERLKIHGIRYRSAFFESMRCGDIVVEILREFPELEDPRTGKTLIDRSIIICNTSSMPVAAREASVYTAVTLAEYYRQMGLNVLMLADSTSRWAQALREMSGRLEEIPGEEAFPAYLESLIAAFYERAGLVRLYDNSIGSVTIGGSVSPAGGNFEEPVTQATLKVVGAFLGLSRERSDARRYPAINPLESWSKYTSVVDSDKLARARQTLRRGNEVNQMMKVIGEDGTDIADYIIYLKSEFLDYVYLQQNTFDKVDGATSSDRQRYAFDKVVSVLDSEFAFDDKEAARSWFQSLRQKFIDWNYEEVGSEDFKNLEAALDEQIRKQVK